MSKRKYAVIVYDRNKVFTYGYAPYTNKKYAISAAKEELAYSNPGTVVRVVNVLIHPFSDCGDKECIVFEKDRSDT